jgi:hypothetical protein
MTLLLDISHQHPFFLSIHPIMYRNDDRAGFKNAAGFLKITEIRWDWPGPNLKLCKKLDQILRTLVEKLFSNHRFDLLDKIQIELKP